ncbi:hypothetical protein BaRGS_00037016, partial [Batillaria attramentaria]
LHGEEAEPALHTAGENVNLSWKLPVTDATVITVAKDNYTQTLFSGSTQEDRISTYSQYKDRVQVLPLYTGSVSFTMKNVTASDAGRYVCFVDVGDVKIPDCGQMLVIIDRPEEATVTATEAAVVGQDLQLECVAESTSLPTDHGLPLLVQWYDSSGLEVTGREDKVQVDGPHLLVRSIERHDEGLHFSCRAADGLDMWSANSEPYTLQPEYAPTESDIQLDPQRSQVEISSGSSVQQECSATCRPSCTLSWQKNDGGGYLTVKENGTLSLPGIQRDKDGTYRCLASNKHGKASQSLEIVVMYAPSLQSALVNGMEQTKARVTEGVRVNMTCLFDSNPAPQVTWYSMKDRNNPLVQRDLSAQTPVISETGQVPRNTYISDFIIPGTECTHTNKYTCTAKNPLGAGIDGSIELIVVCMPRNTDGDLRLKSLYMSPVDQPLNIKFQVVAYPEPKIDRIISEDASGRRQLEETGRWTQSSSKSPAYPYLTTLTLRFPNPTLEFFDKTYYLHISNNEGSKPFAFLLRAKGPPKPPANLTVVSVSDRSVVLRFTPGFHGGKPQTFSVEYQLVTHDDNSSNNWVKVDTLFEATQNSDPLEVEITGLEPSSTYHFRVHAENEHGANTSAILLVETRAADASSASAGPIVGIVIGVLVLVVVVCVIVYIFVIKRRKDADEEEDGQTKEPMLAGEDDRGSSPSPQPGSLKETDSKGSKNNNAHTGPVAEHNDSSEKVAPPPEDGRPRNQDGLIYADLDLNKPSQATPPPERHDAVNYETIDFTRRAPTPPPPSMELASDEEEIK